LRGDDAAAHLVCAHRHRLQGRRPRAGRRGDGLLEESGRTGGGARTLAPHVAAPCRSGRDLRRGAPRTGALPAPLRDLRQPGAVLVTRGLQLVTGDADGKRRMSNHTGDLDPRVQDLLDKQAIRELVIRYFRGIDDLDREAIASVYHPDAVDVRGRRTLTGD